MSGGADSVALIGITTAMLRTAPQPAQVLPSLLEFLSGAILVAHNAPFDAGFLRATCERHGHPWPRPPVLCTARSPSTPRPRRGRGVGRVGGAGPSPTRPRPGGGGA
ncbi:hypothetical protein PA7_09990 [Pseudonocardia asaccharolytica DSM 44247 = NBRC 16224]|uniref:Exonuclease domain-containing protein n=1 Tax=Pseudonocardia asaccharolytica DSM 44247 = NBRC 16224 TaxID=1123024 RepID=A0A511CX85_9PSEU|nr:hypothetical protein PA7_09990 [Pseudonocardia asaccharolytica DSM 44247 = NBRC 16224]